jgi:formamidopyrimidine-DNA glycosylase
VPELPEVETVRRGLQQATSNLAIAGGDVLLDRAIAYPQSASDFIAAIAGLKVAQWYRRGKYLLARLDRPDAETPDPGELVPTPHGWLGVHLRMTGQLLWLPRHTELQKHARVRLFFPQERELRFVDQRTFGQMWWIPPDTDPAAIVTGLQQLGPEPFSADFSTDYLVRRCRNRTRPIKNALLDQRLVAGAGNIYADETLFLSRVRPTKPCGELSEGQIETIRANLVKVLQQAIAAGGTTFSSFLDVQGINGNYAGMAWTYGRAGKPCRICGRAIERIKLAGRSSHFCPRCQSL